MFSWINYFSEPTILPKIYIISLLKALKKNFIEVCYERAQVNINPTCAYEWFSGRDERVSRESDHQDFPFRGLGRHLHTASLWSREQRKEGSAAPPAGGEVSILYR